MSELTQKNDDRDFRWKLLAEASALALMAYIATTPAAKAEDDDKPTVWIELGGQLSRWDTSQEVYAPPFAALTPSDISSPLKAQRPPRYGMDESVALTFQPTGSDWNFSASLRYGRASNSKHLQQQSNPAGFTFYTKFHRLSYGIYHHGTAINVKPPLTKRFADVAAKNDASHTILDFRAGKDMGIGLFTRNATSTLDVGVRFAQFTSRATANLKEDPDFQFKTQINTFSSSFTSYYIGFYSIYRKQQKVLQPFHTFAGAFQANRSFNGLGPSVSWSASEPFVGDPERGALTFDWGVNASLLFGRQKTKIHHQTTAQYHSGNAGPYNFPITYQRATTPDRVRSRGVAVPNIGAFAGLSVKYPNAKVSFGYKADFFFGAMDGGIDVRRTEDVGFHGPYASVSIGLGG